MIVQNDINDRSASLCRACEYMVMSVCDFFRRSAEMNPSPEGADPGPGLTKEGGVKICDGLCLSLKSQSSYFAAVNTL